MHTPRRSPRHGHAYSPRRGSPRGSGPRHKHHVTFERRPPPRRRNTHGRRSSSRGSRVLGGLVEGLSQRPPATTAPEVPRRPRTSGLWVDGSICTAVSRASVVTDIEVAETASSRRPLPLLCSDLRRVTTFQQTLSLRLFLTSLPALHRLPVTAEDAEELLSVLLVIMARRGDAAHTQHQRVTQIRASDHAFRCLCALFKQPGRHTGMFIDAMQSLLARVKKGSAHFEARPELPGPAPVWPRRRRSSVSVDAESAAEAEEVVADEEMVEADEEEAEDDEAVEARRAEAEKAEEELMERAADAVEVRTGRLPLVRAMAILRTPMMELRERLKDATRRLAEASRPPTPPPADAVPFLQTLDCVDPALLGPANGASRGALGDLTESRFARTEADFFRLDIDASGTLDFRELGSGQGVAMIYGVNVASYDFFTAVDKDSDGTLTLSELLHHWYPCVPRRFIRRRAAIAIEQRRAALQVAQGGGQGAVGYRGKLHADDYDESDGMIGDVRIVCDSWREGLEWRARWEALQQDESGEDDPLPPPSPPPKDPPSLPPPQNAAPSLQPPELLSPRSRADIPRLSVDTAESEITTIISGIAGAFHKAAKVRLAAVDDDAMDAANQGERWKNLKAAMGVLRRISCQGLKLSKKELRQPWGEAVAIRLKDSFDAMDIDHSGEISYKEIQMNGGEIGGMKITTELFRKIDKDRSGQVDLIEMCRALYPNETLASIKSVVAAVEKDAGKRRNERVRLCENDERMYARKKADEEAKQQQTRNALSGEISLLCRRLEQPAEPTPSDSSSSASSETPPTPPSESPGYGVCVPLVHTCEGFPVTTEIGGLRIGASHLNLDSFVEMPGTRAAAADLLQTLDAAGVDTRGLCHSFRLLPVRTAECCRVYRAFASAQFSVPASRRGAAHVVFRSNLRRRSNIRFRFLFEGQNTVWDPAAGRVRLLPVNTVVAGATGFPRWTDNAGTIFEGVSRDLSGVAAEHLSAGISSAALEYCDQGFVVVRLFAESYFRLSLVCSAWLTGNDAGATFPVTGSFAVAWADPGRTPAAEPLL